jgi:hypothetical protein
LTLLQAASNTQNDNNAKERNFMEKLLNGKVGIAASVRA